MRDKPYFSARSGKLPNYGRLDLDKLKSLFASIHNQLVTKDYFQEALGYDCVDAGMVPGTLGEDIDGVVFIHLRRDNLWPITKHIHSWEEHDLFDVMEFLFDIVSKPLSGHYHSYSNCGWHYSTFDKREGQEEFRRAFNPILSLYGHGYHLAEDGEVRSLPDKGMQRLFEASIPTDHPDNIEQRVQAAVSKFTRHRSSMEDRRDALRDLADVLEFLRPSLKGVLLSKDESDLFAIANNFGIRHHNDRQKTNYDRAIWYSWIFYFYLATIHASLRLIERHKQLNESTQGENREGEQSI